MYSPTSLHLCHLVDGRQEVPAMRGEELGETRGDRIQVRLTVTSGDELLAGNHPFIMSLLRPRICLWN